VVAGGRIFGKGRGGLVCANLASGETQWHERVRSGQVCWADGMLYDFADNGGRISLVDPDAKDKVKGSFAVDGEGRSWSYPVVVDGRLLLRYHTNQVSLWRPDGTPGDAVAQQAYGVEAVDLSRDAKRPAWAGENGIVSLWSRDESKQPTCFAHTGPINTVSWSPTDEKLLSGAADGLVIVWDAKTGEPESSRPATSGKAASLPKVFGATRIHTTIAARGRICDQRFFDAQKAAISI